MPLSTKSQSCNKYLISDYTWTSQTALKGQKDKEDKNYSTQYSRVVPHRSTDWAITSLTSEIRRDPVLPSVYGRS
jgi:hypothetical protein